MSKYQIDVFIYTSGVEGYQNRVSQTQAIFKGYSNSYGIDVTIKAAKVQPDVSEITTFNECVKQSRPDSYVLIVKDTSTSTTSATDLFRTISWALDHSLSNSILEDKSFDVMWLSKWMDDCAKHETIKSDERGMRLVVTSAPYGTQCLLFSRSGIKKIVEAEYPEKDVSFSNYLNSGVRNDKLVGVALHPSPIKFDTKYISDSNLEYAKTSECADVKGSILPQKKQSNIAFFVTIVIAILIVVAIYVLIKYGTLISNAYERSVKARGEGLSGSGIPIR